MSYKTWHTFCCHTYLFIIRRRCLRHTSTSNLRNSSSIWYFSTKLLGYTELLGYGNIPTKFLQFWAGLIFRHFSPVPVNMILDPSFTCLKSLKVWNLSDIKWLGYGHYKLKTTAPSDAYDTYYTMYYNHNTLDKRDCVMFSGHPV